MFDGHTALEPHYVAVITTYPFGATLSYSSICLAKASLEDETTQVTHGPTHFLKFLFSVFGNSESNIVSFIGDDYSLNHPVSEKLHIPLLGCVSLRFQIAVKEIMAGEDSTVSPVQQLIKKLHTPRLSGKLPRQTHLKPKGNVRYKMTLNIPNAATTCKITLACPQF